MSKAVRLPQSATAPSAAATAAAPSATSATPSAFSNKPTAASKCVAVGDGLKHTTVNQFGIFTVQTRDAEGVPKEESDDDLVVTIRLVGGGEKLRTRMLNNKDGTFTVGYKPIVSGRYNVDVKLNNEPLPDSPYSCIVSTMSSMSFCTSGFRKSVFSSGRPRCRSTGCPIRATFNIDMNEDYKALGP